MKKNWIIYTLIIGLISSCGSEESASDLKLEHHDEEEATVELTQAQYESAEIELGFVEKRSISGVISANGLLDVPPQ